VGIHQFNRGLVLIAREHPAEAYRMFDLLNTRFSDRRYYPSLPQDARKLYIAATHFARGAFAIFRAHSEAALASADALDATGWKFYAMIASQLRFLYYTNRGEFAKAVAHRQQVELHAVQVGSAWQVELWEAPALLLIHTSLEDVVGATRLAHRLDTQCRTAPSLKLYSRLSREALALARGEASFTRLTELIAALEPRSYIGWAAAHGFLARSHNRQRRYAEAKAICERILSLMTDTDREYVTLFLVPEVELAIADAGLGMTAQGLQRVDALLERFNDCDHPLAHGLLHEARAHVAWLSGDRAGCARSLKQMEAYFLPTGSPELIARCELLTQLASPTVDEASARQATIAPVVADAASEAHTQAVTRAYPHE
jgi:phage tail protein X